MKKWLHALTSLVALSWVIVVLADSDSPKDAAAAEQELAELRGRIGTLEREIAKQGERRSSAEEALRAAERSESEVRSKLRQIDRQVAATRETLAVLEGQVEATRVELRGHLSILERQLRLAYVAGKEQWLRMVLSQRDAVTVGRQLVYYSYVARQRSTLIDSVDAALEELKEKAVEVDQEQQRLEELEAVEQRRLEELSSIRQSRGQALARIDKDIASQGDQIDGLRLEAKELELLVAELTRLLATLPSIDATNFAEKKGAMGWPAEGRLIRKFGQSKADGRLRWDGVLLDAEAGSEVKAVHHGRVVFSDWLPGMGLLIVVEHGDGYLSLYGHNRDLIREVGEWVTSGTVIAHVGDSGGQVSAGLYFEIRKDGQPVDPGKWIRE